MEGHSLEIGKIVGVGEYRNRERIPEIIIEMVYSGIAKLHTVFVMSVTRPSKRR